MSVTRTTSNISFDPYTGTVTKTSGTITVTNNSTGGNDPLGEDPGSGKNGGSMNLGGPTASINGNSSYNSGNTDVEAIVNFKISNTKIEVNAYTKYNTTTGKGTYSAVATGGYLISGEINSGNENYLGDITALIVNEMPLIFDSGNNNPASNYTFVRNAISSRYNSLKGIYDSQFSYFGLAKSGVRLALYNMQNPLSAGANKYVNMAFNVFNEYAMITATYDEHSVSIFGRGFSVGLIYVQSFIIQINK